MSHTLSAPAARTVNTAAIPTWTWMRWADLGMALLLAVLGLACAGRSLAMMVEIPTDTSMAIHATGAPSSADTMAARPPPRTP